MAHQSLWRFKRKSGILLERLLRLADSGGECAARCSPITSRDGSWPTRVPTRASKETSAGISPQRVCPLPGCDALNYTCDALNYTHTRWSGVYLREMHLRGRVTRSSAAAWSSHAQITQMEFQYLSGVVPDGFSQIPVFQREELLKLISTGLFPAAKAVQIPIRSVPSFLFLLLPSFNSASINAYAFQASPREPACSLPCPPARIVPVSSPLPCRAHCHSRCRVSQTE